VADEQNTQKILAALIKEDRGREDTDDGACYTGQYMALTIMITVTIYLAVQSNFSHTRTPSCAADRGGTRSVTVVDALDSFTEAMDSTLMSTHQCEVYCFCQSYQIYLCRELKWNGR
jgi:hypothetical protein